MKKIMIIAMGVFCMCVTSCSDICKDAYMAEQAYKLYREKGWADSTLYKNEFIEMYQSMSRYEQQKYKSYREQMDAELREQAAAEYFARLEALKMLNE